MPTVLPPLRADPHPPPPPPTHRGEATTPPPATLESSPVRVEIIRNETNLGYAAGCNQGIAKARGRYLVFLNNDTVVTAAWFDGLVAWALHDWPQVGLVSP